MAMTGTGISSYLTNADGTITDGTKWSLIDPTSYNDITATNETNTMNQLGNTLTSTTAFQKSSTFTLSSGITIDGVAIFVNQINSTTGTFTVALDQANTTVSGTSVTCNVTDLPASGWIFFKFASSVTLSALAYSVKTQTSTTGTVGLGTNNGTNHLRLLRTTTTGTAPQNGSSQNDNIYIIGECTGAGATTTRNMTWNVTSVTNPFNSFVMGGLSTCTVEGNASTNYYLFTNNDVRILGGTFICGTSGSPLPSSSLFKILFNISGQTLVVTNGGTLSMYGATKTTATVLTADAAASATSISVGSATNWTTSDTIGIGTTDSNTGNHCEARAISSISGTTIGVSALTNAHKGTSPYIAEVINLTRNIQIYGKTNSTAQGYIFFLTGSTINLSYVEIANIGGNNIGNFVGISMYSALGNGGISLDHCALHDFQSNATGINLVTVSGSISITNNVLYHIDGEHLLTPTSNSFTGTIVVTGNTFMLSVLSNYALVVWGLASSLTTFSNNTMVGGVGNTIGGGFCLQGIGTYGTFSGNKIHGCNNQGLYINTSGFSAALVLNFGDWTIYHCTIGVYMPNQLTSANLIFTGLTLFSNTTANFEVAATFTGVLTIQNGNFQAGSINASPRGLYLTANANAYQTVNQVYLDNCVFGTVTTHSTGDIVLDKACQAVVYMRNCLLSSSNMINSQTNLSSYGVIGSDRHQQTDGNYATFLPYGTITRDTTIYGNASPSMRVTPNNLTTKFASASLSVTVPGGQSPTVSIRVRKSNTSAGDSATYNGDQPQFVMAANPQAGINTDTVMATCTSASNGAWETLTATIPTVTGDSIISFYILCDGTAGWINVDDFTTTQVTANQGNLSFSRGGQPFCILGNGTNSVIPVPVIRKRAV